VTSGLAVLIKNIVDLTINSSGEIGLAMRSSPPLMMLRARFSKSLCAVTKMTGVDL
jgi:hypothetical protein